MYLEILSLLDWLASEAALHSYGCSPDLIVPAITSRFTSSPPKLPPTERLQGEHTMLKIEKKIVRFAMYNYQNNNIEMYLGDEAVFEETSQSCWIQMDKKLNKNCCFQKFEEKFGHLKIPAWLLSHHTASTTQQTAYTVCMRGTLRGTRRSSLSTRSNLKISKNSLVCIAHNQHSCF